MECNACKSKSFRVDSLEIGMFNVRLPILVCNDCGYLRYSDILNILDVDDGRGYPADNFHDYRACAKFGLLERYK